MTSIEQAIAKTRDKISFLNALISPNTEPHILEQIQIQVIAYQDCLRILEVRDNNPQKLDD